MKNNQGSSNYPLITLPVYFNENRKIEKIKKLVKKFEVTSLKKQNIKFSQKKIKYVTVSTYAVTNSCFLVFINKFKIVSWSC